MTAPRIAIVGGGASGTVLALQFLERAPSSSGVLLFEAEGPMGRGLAYGTEHLVHLLNVRAGQMSIWPDKPDDFVDWLEARRWRDPADPSLSRHLCFAPRRLYGDYLADRLRRSALAEPGRLRSLPRRVVDVIPEPPGYRLLDETGEQHLVECVVLALGVSSASTCDRPHVLPDPWAPEALEGLGPEADVLLLGTGLTAVDLTLALLERGHRGKIRLLSRRGLLPRPHSAPSTWRAWLDPTARPQGMATLLWSARREAAAAAREGVPWQAVVDALRPVTQALWLDLSHDERARFLRHLRPWWDVHRHRMPQPVADRLAAATRSRKLEISAGRLLSCERVAAGAVEVSWRPRGGDVSSNFTVERVIDCTGGQSDPRLLSDPLVEQLLERGLGRADRHGLGFDVDPACRLLDGEGRPMRRLYAIGPLTRATFWESTAIPDIRTQARRLTERLLSELAPA